MLLLLLMMLLVSLLKVVYTLEYTPESRGELMLIHELAEQVDLSVDTIRFYEKQGLLDHTHFIRQSNKYRVYTEAAVRRVRLIRQAQAAGFTLREMRNLIHSWESDQLTIEQKEAVLKEKMLEIDQRIADLLECKTYLADKLAAIHCGGDMTAVEQHNGRRRKLKG